MMETIKKLNIRRSQFICCEAKSSSSSLFAGSRMEKPETKFLRSRRESQSGMSLIAVMAVMTLFAISLLAIAPTVQQGIQREKELESIRRGEEVAEAVRQYVV